MIFKYNDITKLLILTALSLLLGGCSTNGMSGKPDHYRGHFFDAEVSGQKVIAIRDKASKTGLESYIRKSNVRWQLEGKAKSPLKIRIIPNQWTSEFMGTFQSKEIQVVPLQGQKKDTVAGLSRSKDVMHGGSAAVSVKKYLQDSQLPPGAYVIRVKMNGSENWDRKEVYAEFE